jgi:DHA2 family multidrug resistance protein
LASLQYVLERGEHDDWWNSNTIILLTVVSTVALIWFIWKSTRDKHPLVDMKVFRYRTFTIGNLIGTIMGFGLFGTSLVLPLFFQTILGLTAFDTGLVLLPGALATAVSMLIVGRLIGRVDGRFLIAGGMALFGVTCWWLGRLTSDAGYWDVFWPRLWQGFALGFLFVPLSTVSLGDIPIAELAGATGVSVLLRQLGGSFGIAILTTMLTHQTAVATNVLASGVTQTQGYPIPVLSMLVSQQAAVIAYNYLFQVTAIVFFACLPLVIFMKAPPANKGAPAAAAAAE